MDEALDPDLSHDSLVHDLKNVFETIADVAELLNSDRKWKPLAATLSRSVKRGMRLVGAIPDPTRNMSAIVDDAIQSVTDYCQAARKPRMRWVRRIPSEVRLPGAPKDWERVFVNLFLNTAEAMHCPGRIEIETQAAANGLSIVISDNGPGIAAEILPGLFRAHVSTKTNGKANAGARSGLGLHIVASIVKKYSGKVAAVNREGGGGAVFTISLPEDR